ncbi:hypothetical protein [Vibrio hyugaensis]|uniref:Uncharacterized protein n=1 Tax=Vibrio hyugaensis TaxID=1534743 RepID=A0ABQ5XW42_9VIBR|nr:hypothetical protein [Vibrio hyugaensis]GLR02684.1 hypothetical protein GCM10007906_02710 [Vibrio hyugaensis]
MNKILLPLVAVASSFSAYAAEERYSMEDLAALHKAQSWNELLYHANDIRPSKRDDAWQSLVADAATGAFNNYVSSGAADSAIGLGQQLLAEYAFLSESNDFTQSFVKTLVPAAQSCIKYSMEGCVESYGQLLVELSPAGNVSFEEGTKVFQNVSKSLAVPFYAAAIKQSPEYCENEKVSNALLYTLDRPSNSQFALAKEVATDGCANTVLTNFENYIIESQSVRETLCPTYLSKGYVEGVMKKVCQS